VVAGVERRQQRGKLLPVKTAVMAFDRTGRNASAFKGARRQATGWRMVHDVSSGLRQAGPGEGDGH
jgi:hypothetical protein